MSKTVLLHVRRQPRRAFTVVELLVVIAIIGVMVGMLLPAVGAVRDSARRTQNENNLKQLCTAIMSFEGQHGTYPAMVKRSKEDPSDLTKSVSWAFQILPFMEQENVYEKFDDAYSCFDPRNSVAMTTPIDSFVNPRRRDARAISPFLNGNGLRGAPLDYAGNGGVVDPIIETDRSTGQQVIVGARQLPSDPSPVDVKFNARYSGPFHPDFAVPSTAVRDGLSNTICVGDRWINPQALNRLVSGGPITPEIALNDPAGLAGDSVYATVRYANPDRSNQAFPFDKTDTSIFKFGSPKGADACFGFLDGHVRWLPYDLDLKVFIKLSAINDGFVIPANELP